MQGQSMHSNARNTKLESKLGTALFIEVVFEIIEMFETDSHQAGIKDASCKEEMNVNFDNCIFEEVSRKMKVYTISYLNRYSS